MWEAIEIVIHVLRSTQRFGRRVDDPEGVRYIQISDTLANEMASGLEQLLNKLKTQRKSKGPLP